ncbi:tol-pal system protein YbgF [Fulvimonas sp. R45]|uniref:tol-pal system protein YbgF n=1 Tax=Fulvimonas sp. R45 TaxID=3045937 RepID=UPI00265D719B|nr:tol-pal system protein YbgF [Fulvimonas sp. R45]MDO1527770.1 tol-pal system protein YbgF [Fulvimonas sp. R45]
MTRIGTAGAIASAVLFVLPLHAQDSRLSLADRVSRLEQQVQNRDQGGTSLVNRLQQMQAQMQQMQGQIEELQHQLQELQDKGKAQYVDLDSRLGRLEHATASPNAAQPAAAGSAPAAAASAGAGNGNAGGAATPPPAAAGKPAPGRPDAAMQSAYDAAFKALRGGDYVTASRGFRDYIQKYPDTTLTPNAFYWLGESYYVTTNYQVAAEAFQHLLGQFPDSEKAPDALLKLGYSQLELKQQDKAEATLKSVVARYPGSKAASLAKERLRRLEQSPAR